MQERRKPKTRMKLLPLLLSAAIALSIAHPNARGEITDDQILRIPFSEIQQTIEHLDRNLKAADARADGLALLEAESRERQAAIQAQLDKAAKRDAEQAATILRQTGELAKKDVEIKKWHDESDKRGSIIGKVCGIVALLTVHALIGFFAPMLKSLSDAFPAWKLAIFAAKFVLPALAFPAGYFLARIIT